MIPMVGSPAPRVSTLAEMVDLLTGRSSTFKGGIGGWTASGGGSTCTYDAAYTAAPGRGSMKFHNTTISQTASVALPGTFLLGRHYQLELLVQHSTLTTTDTQEYSVALGLIGTDSASTVPKFTGPDATDEVRLGTGRYYRIVVPWSPGANRTGVTVRITRSTGSGTHDLFVASARVVLVPTGSPGFIYPVYHPFVQSGKPEWPVIGALPALGFATPRTQSGGPDIANVGSYAARMYGPADAAGDTTEAYAGLYGMFLYGVMPAGNQRRAGGTFEGIEEEVGPDYVGWMRSARDASTLDMYPDGDYDIHLIDGGDDADTTHHWKTENSDGTKVSKLALLHLLMDLGTTDPSAGGGVAATAPKLGIRLNGAATEVWAKTGGADTAWTQIT